MSVLLIKRRDPVVMHASIWILVPICARHKTELKPQRKTHESARTKEERGEDEG